MDTDEYCSDLEKRILKVVGKITNNRNRPCYQNIFALLNRGDFKIDCTELNGVIDCLVERGILRNTGTAEKESFRIVMSPVVENDFESGKDINISGDILNNTEDIINITGENMSTNGFSSVTDFINNKFYETLTERIKSEVIKCVELKLRDYDIPYISQSFHNCAETCKCKDNNILINDVKNKVEQLREIIPSVINESQKVNQNNGDAVEIMRLNRELEQLRLEIKSKDKVIEMLATGNNNKRTSAVMNNDYVNGKIDNVNKYKPFNKHNNNNSFAENNRTWDGTLSDAELVVNDDASFTKVTYRSNRKPKDSRTISVLGDSIVKDIKGYKLKPRLEKNERIYIKSFSGSTVNDMIDYARPTIRKEPDLIILHVGSNDLRSEKTADNIASDVMKLALEMRTENNDVMISSLVFRDDNPGLNNKGKAVNLILKAECEQYNIMLIDNSNIQKQHLNGSKLHLNYKGTVTLANNILNHIKV